MDYTQLPSCPKNKKRGDERCDGEWVHITNTPFHPKFPSLSPPLYIFQFSTIATIEEDACCCCCIRWM
jgi:hypothetical protein